MRRSGWIEPKQPQSVQKSRLTVFIHKEQDIMNKTLLATALVVMGGAALFARDVIRFRGDNSQGMYLEEKGLLKTWPQGGLTPKWTATGFGEGWSSPIKVGNRLYLTGTVSSGGQQGAAAPQQGPQRQGTYGCKQHGY